MLASLHFSDGCACLVFYAYQHRFVVFDISSAKEAILAYTHTTIMMCVCQVLSSTIFGLTYLLWYL